MKTLILICFVCFFCNIGLAHDSNVAFFTYTQKETTIEVEAEFPWSMRNALMEFNPLLENSANKKDFENTFDEYIKKNLILQDKDGKLLQYQSFIELENNGNSHQNNYLIIFKGTDLYKITNTFMFNLYDNQSNYNKLFINDTPKTFITKKGSTQFYVNQTSDTNYSWYLLILLIPLFYLIKRSSKFVKI